MTSPSSTLLCRACRTFLQLAYPEGELTIPAPKRVFWDLRPDSLATMLIPPLCQPLTTAKADYRGYAIRLGSAAFPHLKLQMLENDAGICVFSVDTHDALRLPADHPEAAQWTKLQTVNRILKQRIEQAWEAEGLTTFNSMLRQDLNKR